MTPLPSIENFFTDQIKISVPIFIDNSMLVEAVNNHVIVKADDIVL